MQKIVITVGVLCFGLAPVVRGNDVASLIKQLSARNNDRAKRASDELAAMGESVVPELAKALESGNHRRRRFAARALRQIGQDAADAIPALSKSLKDTDVLTREYAVEALGTMVKQAEQVIPVLRQVAEDDDNNVREKAKLAIARLTGYIRSQGKSVEQPAVVDVSPRTAGQSEDTAELIQSGTSQPTGTGSSLAVSGANSPGQKMYFRQSGLMVLIRCSLLAIIVIGFFALLYICRKLLDSKRICSVSQRLPHERNFSGEKAILTYFIIAKLIICLFPFEYGYFRDELYYIALSDNLDFGYVDVPPIVPFLLAIVRSVLGTSFFSLHLVPAICGALVVWLVSLMVKKLGGGSSAQLLALTCVTFAPIYLCWESTYTYDVFDKLNWTLILYVMVLLLKTEDKKYWIYFGLVVGFALLTKITILFLVFGILCALAATKERRYFLSPQLWIGGLLALLLSSPYIIWQIKEGLPALEYYGSYASGKTWPSTPPEFIKNQVLTMNVLAFPVWALGIYYFIFDKEGKRLRVLGYAYFVVLIVCVILKAKFFLPAPFYTVLFAGGAVRIERFAEERNVMRLKRSPAIAIFLIGFIQIPFARPIVPIDPFVKYTGRSIWEGIKGERHDLGRLPQHFHDRFGWDKMAESVKIAYDGLSEPEKSKVCVLTGNYGEAGAIWVHGKRHNLPKPISGHLQYCLWGTRGHSAEVVISVGIDIEKLKEHFDDIKVAHLHGCRWAIPYEKYLDIHVCRMPNKSLEEMWPSFKHLD
ncbi:MAG: glycosyltransferase family 39 protein [Planctomycetota bacterium]